MIILYKTDNEYLREAFIKALENIGYKEKNVYGGTEVLTTVENEWCISNYDSSNARRSTKQFNIEREWNEALAYARKQMKPTFEIGDWVYVKDNGSGVSHDSFINSQKGSVYRISRLDYDSGKATKTDPRYISKEGYNCRAEGLRKATPEEIENALIKEAKRRGYKKDNVIFSAMTGAKLKIGHVGYRFNRDGTGDDLALGGCCIYRKGKWAKIIKDTKFFEWDVEEQTYVIKIGCETYRKDFLQEFKEVISKLDNRITISELTEELKKLNLT